MVMQLSEQYKEDARDEEYSMILIVIHLRGQVFVQHGEEEW